jgi:hypothetical protein
MFRLSWTETDGPDAENIGHSGFGRVALQRVTPAALGGRGSLQIAKGAIVWAVEGAARLRRVGVSRFGVRISLAFKRPQ